MADYRKMYLHLVDAVARTMVLGILDSSRAPDQKLFLSHALLAEGLQTCETIYVESDEA